MAGTREDAVWSSSSPHTRSMLGLADATEKIFGDEFDPERAKPGSLPCESCLASTRRSPRS
jgi:hypothetical protein